jgi:hypothetical protein
MVYYLTKDYALQKQHAIEEKAAKLGHIIEYSEYGLLKSSNFVTNDKIRSERKAILKIRCNKHNNLNTEPVQTTYYNYLRATNGLRCCSNECVSQKLFGRITSEQSKQNISIAMKKVWSTKPKEKDKRYSFDYDKWRLQVQTEG